MQFIVEAILELWAKGFCDVLIWLQNLNHPGMTSLSKRERERERAVHHEEALSHSNPHSDKSTTCSVVKWVMAGETVGGRGEILRNETTESKQENITLFQFCSEL